MSGLTLQFPIVPFDCFHPSPAKKFLSLIKSPGTLSPTYIENTFRELKSLSPDQILGDWDGFILPTGHPLESELEELNWVGNTFDSTEDVVPLIIARNGERVDFEDWGRASLREIKYQGLVSTALVYDEHPTMVYYRAVRSNLVAGAVETKRFRDKGKCYFYLVKS
ncbi:hypothetical protein N7492_010534 [Penicillium capsulatum]|uniref:GXWXG domain-containing protein n=1 Tax=Penicillium capsulatum TaxID=69766 RepID=A0A9W9HNR9_9EURO|nr:hypothetical protein N7492_010534 [Penicillium capsulatum]KAJ6113036.1 hypothetical protein N7512_008360 [Penicillium capsulatum]